ncbi:integrase core domain-containing protein [Streptomyces ossamyceticus]|uniref:integrase core domain-containing protein n=1 Tax=Streptomyces ossamyceticus TaxID=249581 RepID=UPI0039C8D8B3
MAEALNGTFKAELIEMQGPWRDVDQVERAIFQWVTRYNEERLHSALDYVPPAEYERDLRELFPSSVRACRCHMGCARTTLSLTPCRRPWSPSSSGAGDDDRAGRRRLPPDFEVGSGSVDLDGGRGSAARQ